MGSGDYYRMIKGLKAIDCWRCVRPEFQTVSVIDDLIFKPPHLSALAHLASVGHRAYKMNLFTQNPQQNCWYLLLLEADFYGYQPASHLQGLLEFSNPKTLQEWLATNLIPKATA